MFYCELFGPLINTRASTHKIFEKNILSMVGQQWSTQNCYVGYKRRKDRKILLEMRDLLFFSPETLVVLALVSLLLPFLVLEAFFFIIDMEETIHRQACKL